MGEELKVAEIIEIIENEIYREDLKTPIDTNKSRLENMISKYFVGFLKSKNIVDLESKSSKFCKSAVEHLTGNYNYGLGNKTFEELDSIAKSVSLPIAYADGHELESPELSETIVDGNIMMGAIPTDSQMVQTAKESYLQRPEAAKVFFQNAIENMKRAGERFFDFVNKASHSKGYDNLNGLISLLEVSYEKRHFVPVQNSQGMQKKIQNEGIIHFTAPSNLEKIMESGSIKSSGFANSYYTKGKSFFFAGVPNFENLIINLSPHDVMTAIKIMPTNEQISQLNYRALNDKAITHDGDFNFSPEQAKIVYYGLKYDKENDKAYYAEISEDEAKNFQVSDEVKKLRMGKLKYGLAVEYKHHKKILELKKKMKEHGINNFYEISAEDLDRETEIQEYAVVGEKNGLSKVADFVKESLKKVPLSLMNKVGNGIVKDYMRNKEKEGISRWVKY